MLERERRRLGMRVCWNTSERASAAGSSLLRALAKSLAIGAFVAPIALGACSSDEGAGSEAACTPGATQTCTGISASGTCEGAQVCKADGSGWGDCICGGAGGSAGSSGGPGSGGSSGSMGGAGNGGTAGSATGGASGSSGAAGSGAGGSAGSGGSSADAGPDATVPKQPGPLDDPCSDPNTFPYELDLNCSDQCEATDTAACAAQFCIQPQSAPIVADVKELPFTIRVPANPAMTCSCTGSTTVQQYSLMFRVDLPHFKATVGKPWYVTAWGTGGATQAYCLIPENAPAGPWAKGCYVSHAPLSAYVTVATNDPAAPSRVLTIEPALPSTDCFSNQYWQ